MKLPNLLTGINLSVSTLLLAILLHIAGVNAALAGDDGLYDAPPPTDAAFVRILNAKTSGEMQSVMIGEQVLEAASRSISPYVIIKVSDPALATVLGSQPKAGSYYTIAVSDSLMGSKVFDDESLSDPAKSRLFFYNLTDKTDVELYVPAVKTTAIKPIGANASNSVELKAPLKLDFVARAGADELAEVSAVTLKRRTPVSIVLFGTAGNYAAISTTNSVDTQSTN
jgi:Alginate O-acetyl transferase AlgF